MRKCNGLLKLILTFFQCSKIQKYSPTESAKVYDKAVNRKTSVHFSPRQTIDFLHNDDVHDDLTYELKRKIVKQYLDVRERSDHFFALVLWSCLAPHTFIVLL